MQQYVCSRCGEKIKGSRVYACSHCGSVLCSRCAENGCICSGTVKLAQ